MTTVYLPGTGLNSNLVLGLWTGRPVHVPYFILFCFIFGLAVSTPSGACGHSTVVQQKMDAPFSERSKRK